MAILLPSLRAALKYGSGVQEPSAKRAVQALEAWSDYLTDRLSKMQSGAGDVPSTRAINTTAPLTGGGTLAADITLDISTFTAAVKGAVPAPITPAGYFLKDDGTWADIAVSGGDAIFGTGADGALVFDGAATVAGLAPVANVYTLVRDLQATTVSCTGSGAIAANGYRLLATTSATNIVLRANGSAGLVGAGGAGAPAGFLGGATAGGNASNGQGANNTAAPPTLCVASAANNGGAGGGAGGNGAPGTVGTVMRGGGAGGDGNSVNNGGQGGQQALTTASAGIETVLALAQGKGEQSTTRWTFGTGGGAGGNGGAGGGGAGCVVVCAPTITAGVFETKGGDAAVPLVGGTSGGGGGGGGGLVVLVYRARVGGTVTVTGGAGTAGATNGVNSGGQGAAGGAGASVNLRIVGGTGGGGSGTLLDGDYGDITVSGAGSSMQIDAGAVGAPELASDAVTTVKILNANVTTAKIADDNVTMAKIEDAAGARLVGALVAGNPSYLTGTQATTLLGTVTTSAKGLVPTASNVATEFLNGLGAWAVPAGGGGGGSGVATSAASVYALANQSISSAVATAINYTAEHYDTANYHSTVTNNTRLTAPVTGVYLITGHVNIGTSASGFRYAQIRKNGADYVSTAGTKGVVTYDAPVAASTCVSLVAGDYVELMVWQDSGGALDVKAGLDMTFEMTLQQATIQPQSGASVHNAGVTQSVANTTEVALTFSTELYDTGSYHSTTVNTSRVTVPVTGYYFVAASAFFFANATGQRQVNIRKNGTTGLVFGRVMYSIAAGVDTHVQASGVVYLLAGDYVETVLYHNAGTTLSVYTDSYSPGLTVFLVQGSSQPAFSGASVYRTGNQSVANATYAAITQDLEDYDTDGYHSTTVNTSRFTAPTTAYYHISAAIQYAVNATGLRAIEIGKNGATGGASLASITIPTEASVATEACRITVVALLNAGDYVETFAWQSSGGPLNVSAPSYCKFQIERLGT